MAPSNTAGDVAADISTLSIKATPKARPGKSQKSVAKENVADSWEDENVSSASDDDSRPSTTGQQAESRDGTTAPPPTPIAPNYNTSRPFSPTEPPTSPGIDRYDGAGSGPFRRPEKTDAVARRMIASALGVKVPKLTEDQKAYEKAMKEKERKRREEERAADKKKAEEAEKAKAAIWED